MSISDRMLRWLERPGLTHFMGLLTVGIVIVTLILAVVYGPDILNSTAAVEEGTNLSGCRSSYAAVVTDKRTEFDIARSDRDSIRADADTLLLGLARAAVLRDSTRVQELDRQVDATDAQLREAQARVDKADQALIDANDVYQEAVDLSRSDPDAFLITCKEDGL